MASRYWSARPAILGLFVIGCISISVHVSRRTQPYSQPVIVSNKTYDVNFKWQEMFTDFYVYSVYPTVLDPVELHATVMGPSNDRKFWKATVCRCRYRYSVEAGLSDDVTDGVLTQFVEGHAGEGNSILAGRLTCPVPVSAIKSSFAVEFRCSYGSASGALEFAFPVIQQRTPKSLSVAQCGSVIFGDYDQPAWLIEYIEYYRLMGVEKFFWYKLAVSNRTAQVLNYYRAQNVLDVTEWQLPWEKSRIHYFGQVAALYDCAMRTAGLFDYTVVSDLDELFATSAQPATFSGILNGGFSDCAVVRSSYMDAKANYADAFDLETGGPQLKSKLISQRSEYIWPTDQRSKYICRMRYVDKTMIHTVQSMRDHRVIARPPPETTILLHYRAAKVDPVVNESRAAVHAEELEARVLDVWKEIFG